MQGRTALSLLIASAALLAVVGAFFLVPGAPSPVTVSSVNISGGDSCPGYGTGYPGFTTVAGGQEHFSMEVLNDAWGNCTIDSISLDPSGFTVTGANTPLLVPPGFRTLSFLVQVPLFFNGVLTLNFTGSWSPSNPPPVNNSTCPSPCISFGGVPSGFYMYNVGEVEPTGWVLVEGASIGTIVAAVAWTYSRRN